eukprot:19242-Eustigmatos_ZCMA.PRE.1
MKSAVIALTLVTASYMSERPGRASVSRVGASATAWPWQEAACCSRTRLYAHILTYRVCDVRIRRAGGTRGD